MKPASGVLGALTPRTFLTMLEAADVSGTLFFGPAPEPGRCSGTAGPGTLIVLRRGKPASYTDLGGKFDIDRAGAQFGFWSHADTEQPTLPSRHPAFRSAWALPALGETPLLSTAETDLRGLVARLSSEAFSGALVLSSAAACGLLLFAEGRLGGAVYEEGARTRSGVAALQGLLYLADPAALTLHALPEPVLSSLLGRLSGFSIDAATGVPEGFSGLELTPAGARYHHAGEVYLQVSVPDTFKPESAYKTGVFARAEHVPNLALPTEPSGWETRRYLLTLRGRDALNPMTELSMRFRGEFGRTGRRALEGFRSELSLEAAAEALGLELSELKSTTERLEQGGFIRPAAETSPTPPLHTR